MFCTYIVTHLNSRKLYFRFRTQLSFISELTLVNSQTFKIWIKNWDAEFDSFFSGNKIIVAVALAVLLSELRTVLSSKAVTTDWWLDPCSTGVPQIRHTRSAVNTQLNISINRIKRLKETLSVMYPNVSI